MSDHDTPTLVSPDDRAEAARADLYGLLARLWAGPPDTALAARVAPDAITPGTILHAPWQALVTALRTTPADAAAAEYTALFLGVGKAEVFLYGSYYLAGFLNETPLVALRHDLTALGLARDPQAGETEDHVAFLCEVMRWLIAGDDIERCNLEQQRRFFRAHLQPWVERLCDAVESHAEARLYADVARFTRAFVQVETQALDMVE